MRKILFLLVLLLSISNLVKAGGPTPDYLTFTSNQDGSTIGFENLPESVKLYYSTNGGGSWDPATSSTSITLNAGKSVQFYGDNPNGLYDESLANIPPAYPGAPLPPQPETQFKITGDVSVSGNIAYLMSQSGSVMDLHEKNYYKLFEKCDITDASGLILLSQELAESCYERMFNNCTKLIKAPELPATQLANSCYYFMFGGCNALTQAPELPATTLAPSCYEDMFYKCGLTSAPELPATVMKDNCYYAMFSGCESLTEAPVLPATQLAYSCYYCMFISCKALTQAPELPATQLADRCYFEMFGYCESLTHAPFLPATTLASECYRSIFQGCNNLEYVEVAFTDWGENNKYTKDWLSYTPSSGTFICPESLDKSNTGSSGIPDGWKTQNYVDYLTFTSNEDGSEIVFCEFGSGVNLGYSTDRINWFSAGKNTKITLSKGKSVIFRGDNAKGLKQTQFKISGDVSVSGDINTLINKIGGDITLAGQCYQNLFWECKGLTDASKLKLPSTTLSAACYLNMFIDCSNLVYAPELPATTLASECYKSMFSGCSKLVYAPELPATTLTPSCYESMFVGCKALKSAPVLPADELVDKCYGYMFDGCSSLNEIEVAFTEWKSSCTEKWVRDVISKNGIFICPSELEKTFDESNIPEGWKIESPTPYLTFTSKEDGSKVGFVKISSVVSELYYRVDGSDWVDASDLLNNSVTLNNGNKIQFYGNNENGLSNGMDILDRTQFSVTGKVSVSGDLNTLMTNTGGDVGLVEYNYYYLFEDCKGITDASKLSLPSTKMEYKCYYGLFYNCASLTSAPKLPAKNLSLQCYESMFSGCSALTAAPELPATTLAMSCYRFMFSGCTSLTSAPYLPATTLSEGCYYKMFEGCSDLCEIQVDFTSWGNSNTDWVKKVSRTGVFICLNSLEQIIDDSHIPDGWVVENPLTFTANKDGSEIEFAEIAEGANIQYNDGTGWKDASTSTSITLNSGEYVMFKGDYSGATLSNSNYTQFKITGDVSASGDINSLTNGKGGNIKLENKNYYKLFTDCAGLTDASKLKLPSTTLANYCYQYMFLRCTALTSAPALPAKILAVGCYESMYHDCSALTTAPELPAVSLEESCYYQMFKGCSKIKEITVAFTDWNNSSNATYEWVDGVAETGAFICPSDLEDKRGTSNIPTQWKRPEYLTFTSNQDGSTIGFAKIADGAKIEYKEGDGWKDASELKTTPLTLNSGQSVKFRGDYSNVTTSKTVYTQFDITGDVSASGDVNTLIDGVGGDIEELSSYNYSRMFMECAGLTDASGLKLPSKTMSESCCYQMFAACSALTKAPDLKATQMATRCYQEMFNSCTSLTEAPNELPATNLAEYCYADMFHSCRALLQGPTLPATVLSEGCYSYMFYDCTSLLAIPALRATTLAKNCYKNMFKNCSSLFYVTISDCLSAFDNNYTSEWLSGVASVGIFICRDITQVSDIKRGANYIPEGWYVGSYYVALSEDNINEGLSLSKSKYYNKDLEGMLAKIPAYQQMPDINIDNMYSMDDTIKVNPENYEIDDMFYQSSPTADPIPIEYDKTNNTFAVSSLQNGQFVITISGSKLYQVKYYSNDMELGTEIDQNDKTPIVFRKGATKSNLQSFSIDGCFPEIYTDAECTKLLGEDELLVSYCDNGLVKLYKKPIEYTITFDANGGNPIDSLTYTIVSENIDLSTIKSEIIGYDFVKWVDKNGTEVKQISKGSFGDITLKANYTPTQYSIIFDVNGGKPIEPFTYTIESETIDLSTIKAEKEGYHFVKWIDDKDAEVTQIVKGSNGNVALTAQFEAHSFGKWDTTLVATCTGYGLRTHVCACGVVETDTIPASEHKYELTEIIWSADSTSASATFTCEKGDATETVDGVITADTTVVPTVIAEGLLVYTATFIFNGEIYTDTHMQILDKAELTAVDDVQTNQVKVWGYNRVVYIENAEGVAQVFDINGRLVKSAEIYDAHSEFTLDRSGVYIVVVENKSYRICN